MSTISKFSLVIAALLLFSTTAHSADPTSPPQLPAKQLPARPPGAAKPPAQVLTAVAPVIRGYSHSGPGQPPDGNCVARGRTFWILGNHFGAQAGKGVALGGHGIHVELPVLEWHSDAIFVRLPNDPRIQEGQWYYTGIRQLSPAQWLSNIDKNITICRATLGTAAGNQQPDLVVALSIPRRRITYFAMGSGLVAGADA